MGFHIAPLYGDTDLGTAVENAEKVIAKIKTNKFDKEDLTTLASVLETVKTAIKEYED